MTPRIRSAKSWTRRWSWLPRARAARWSARLVAFGLQVAVAGGDVGGAALELGQLDRARPGRGRPADAFGVGGVDLAVEAGEFGGEQFVVGDRGGDGDGLFAGQQHVGLR